MKESPTRVERPRSLRSIFRRSSAASSITDPTAPLPIPPPVFKIAPQPSEGPRQSSTVESSTDSPTLIPAPTDATPTRQSQTRLAPALPKVKEQPQAEFIQKQTPPVAPPHTISSISPTVLSYFALDTATRKASTPMQSPSMVSPRISPPARIDSMNGFNRSLSPLGSPKPALRPQGRLLSFGSSHAPSGNFSAIRSVNRHTSGSNSHKIRFVQESASSLKKRSLSELGVGAYQEISNVSYVRFLEWIRSERLTTLPHKGSRWDKVLIRALYFGEQLHNFDQAIQGFALDSSTAAAVGYGHAQLLLTVCRV